MHRSDGSITKIQPERAQFGFELERFDLASVVPSLEDAAHAPGSPQIEALRALAARSTEGGLLKSLTPRLAEDVELQVVAAVMDKLRLQFEVTGHTPILWSEVNAELRKIETIHAIDIYRITALLEDSGLMTLRNDRYAHGKVALCCVPGNGKPKV